MLPNSPTGDTGSFPSSLGLFPHHLPALFHVWEKNLAISLLEEQ